MISKRWLGFTILFAMMATSRLAAAAPVIALTPAGTIDWGDVRWGNGAQPTRTLTITNSGDMALSVSVIAFSGTYAAEYTLVSPPTLPLIIPAGMNSVLTIRFDPTAAGARPASIDLTSNDPANMNVSKALTGNGTNAVINVTDVDFMVVPDTTTSSLGITVSNGATAPVGVLTVSSASIAQLSTWFSFAAGNGCVAGSTSCTLTGITAPPNKTVNVRCSPPAAASGTQMATVTFTSDTDAGGDDVAAIMCTAGRPNLMLDTNTLDFGNQLYNTTSAAKMVTVSNTGTTNLTFWMSKAGSFPAQYTVSTVSGCGNIAGNPCTVTPGANLAFSVTFSPLLPEGAKTATIHVNNNDPDAGDNPTDVSVTGNCTAPDIGGPASLAFGNVEVGKMSLAQTLTVTNTGTSALTISNAGLTSGGTDYGVLTGTTGAQLTVLNPTETAAWSIDCAPIAQGARPGNFRVTSNAVNVVSGILNVPLTCTGQQGVLSIAVTPYDFGGVRQGTMVTHNFTLTNTGNVAVNNIMYALSPTLVGFTVTAPTFPIASLGAGANVTVTVTFAPMNGTDGCQVVAAGDCAITFTGGWGVTPTMTTTTLVTTGDGLTPGYDTTPPNIDFGNLRFDQTLTRTFTIQLTDPAPVQIQTISIGMLGLMTSSGEFAVTRVQHGATNLVLPFAGFTLSGCPGGVCDSLVVTITCDPAPAGAGGHVAALSAVVTVHSDLPMTPDRTVPLAANATTAMLTVTPATNILDFGAVDMDGGPITQTITLLNNGTGPLDTGNAAKAGTGLARYAFTATGPQTIAPGASFDVMVTFTPIVERPANQFDSASLTFPLTGIYGGPNMASIMIQGRGIDRHISVPPVPQFPNTFRNPGDKAPIMPVTINNMGEAPLNISAVMVTNDPIWSITNPDPVLVPGFGTYDYLVKFAPIAQGKAPDGQLMIMNNDSGMPLVQVMLTGNGLNRLVDMGPSTIDLGYTGIGIPVKLSDVAPSELLHVASTDATNTFQIQSITLDGNADVFTIQDTSGAAPTNLDLAPNMTRQFDVVFTPVAEGDFETTATLYLDMDPTAQSVVTIRGHSLFVDAHGGAGCSTTGGGGSGGVVLVLGALIVARRRRRFAVTGLVVAGVLAAPSASRADPTRNIDLTVFHPTPSTTGSGFQLQSGDVGANGDWVATAMVSYASNPLVLGTVQNDDAAIKTRATIELGGAYAFLGRFEAGLRMPLYFQSGDSFDSSTMFGVPPASGTARGDLTLHAKAKLWRGGLGANAVSLGAGLAVTLPTATDDQFAGVAKPTARPMMLGSMTPSALGRRLTLGLNAGGVIRARSQFANIDQKSGLSWGIGGSYRALDEMWAAVEVFGDMIPGGRRSAPTASLPMGKASMMSTIEVLAGVHYRIERRFSLGVAVGRGVVAGLGAPAIRGLLSLAFTPGAVELAPIHAKKIHVEGDADGDGVLDNVDRCPNEPEDKDMFDDADGCPDPDNDSDGVPDAQDKCPLDPEDRDGFQDDDGCPDKDNDNDGVPDGQDKCPTVAEDKDGFEDADGCLDADNDNDGIPDGADKCPNEPETINGVTDDDGCPDRGDSLVVLSPDRLETLEAVQFNGAKIAKASSNVLGQIGATLRAHGELVRVRITVHVQPTSNAQKDQELSDSRAAEVRDWLIHWGITAARLDVRGFGGTKPLVPASQRGAAQINDRVELIILERK